jgi:aspartate aminotransferase-like enzyme
MDSKRQPLVEPFIQQRIFSPGPTPIPLEAKLAPLDSELYHRTDEFYAMHLRCAEVLRELFGAQQIPVILTCSGTGALEAAMVNLTVTGDEVVVVNGGKFGERWELLARQYGCDVKVLSVELGDSASPEALESLLAGCKSPRAFFVQANETSTGVRHPVGELTAVLKKRFPECLIIVDAISSFGAHPLHMEKDGFDCVISASQKGFGLNPGLAFIALSHRAWSRLSSRPRFYFDLGKELKGQLKGRSAWTPAIGLIQSLEVALQKIQSAGGIAAMVANHERLATAARAAVPAMGLELFPRRNPSNALTAIKVPAGIDGTRLQGLIKERYGVTIPGGQDELKGKILRLSNLGFVNRFDLLHGLAAVEFGLRDMGFKPVNGAATGAGVQAAMQALSRF